MSARFSRLSRFLYPALMLLAGFGYTRSDNYQLDGDGVNFIDMAHGLLHHKAYLAINECWFPGYAVFLAAGRWIAHPSLQNELQVDYYTNLFIFALAIAAVSHFVHSLIRYRDDVLPAGSFVFSLDALLLAAYSILFYSWQREQSLGKIRCDALLAMFLIFGASFAVRLIAVPRWRNAAGLGLTLGLAFLTKSFGIVASLFLFAMVLLFALIQFRRSAVMLWRLAVAVAVFVLVAGPYIAAISHQRDRFTFGEAGNLNYSWFVDGVANNHQAWSGSTGHATLALKHPERLLMRNPDVYSYDQHLEGTFPLWFDVSYFHDRTIAHFYLPGQISAVKLGLHNIVRCILDHPEDLAFLAVLFLFGYRLPTHRSAFWPHYILVVWGVLIVATYTFVLLLDRYVTVSWLLVLVPILCLLIERPATAATRPSPYALSVLFAAVALSSAIYNVAKMQRMLGLNNQHSAYNPDVFAAAQALSGLGVHPGDRVACMGGTCEDPYWAYLAQAQIVSDVGSDDLHPPMPDKQKVLGQLRGVGAKALVTRFSNPGPIPAGWQQLGDSHYFAIPIH